MHREAYSGLPYLQLQLQQASLGCFYFFTMQKDLPPVIAIKF